MIVVLLALFNSFKRHLTGGKISEKVEINGRIYEKIIESDNEELIQSLAEKPSLLEISFAIAILMISGAIAFNLIRKRK